MAPVMLQATCKPPGTSPTIAVALLTLNTSLLTFLLNQLSIMCCVRTQKKAPCGMLAASWCNGGQLLPQQTEGLRVWAYWKNLIHQTIRNTWVTWDAICPLDVLGHGTCTPCCAESYNLKCNPEALWTWAFWSIWKKQYVKIPHMG